MEEIEFSLKHYRNIEVKDLGTITHGKWYSAKANITAGNKHYQLQPHGIWGVRYALLHNDRPEYEVKMSFSGKVTILPVKEAHHFYTIAYGKGFEAGYRLLNYKGEEVATINWGIRRKGWKTVYTFASVPGFTETDEGKLLALLLIRHYYSTHQAGSAAGVVASTQ